MEAIKKLIQDGNYDAAFEQMNQWVDKTHEDEWIQLCSRYNNLKDQNRKGLLDTDKYEIKQNNIINDLLEFISVLGIPSFIASATVTEKKSNKFVYLGVLLIVIFGIGIIYLFLINKEKKYYFNYESYNLPDNLKYTLDSLKNINEIVKDVAVDDNYGWVILMGRNRAMWNADIPPYLDEKLREVNSQKHEILQVSFGTSSRWVLLFNKNEYWLYPDLQDTLRVYLNQYYKTNATIKQIEFGPAYDEWVILIDSNGYIYSNIPSTLLAEIKYINQSNKEIKSLVIDNNEWIILIDKNNFICSANIDAKLKKALQKLKKQSVTIQRVCLLKNNGWIVLTD